MFSWLDVVFARNLFSFFLTLCDTGMWCDVRGRPPCRNVANCRLNERRTVVFFVEAAEVQKTHKCYTNHYWNAGPSFSNLCNRLRKHQFNRNTSSLLPREKQHKQKNTGFPPVLHHFTKKTNPKIHPLPVHQSACTTPIYGTSDVEELRDHLADLSTPNGPSKCCVLQ